MSVELPSVEMYEIPGGSPRKAAFKAQSDEQEQQNNLVNNLQNGSGFVDKRRRSKFPSVMLIKNLHNGGGSLDNTRRRYDYRGRIFPRSRMVGGGEKLIPIPTFASSSSTGEFPSPQNPNSSAKSALINLATAQKQGASDEIALEPSKAKISPYTKIIGGTRKKRLTRKKYNRRNRSCRITKNISYKNKNKNKSRKIKGGNKTKWECLSGGRFKKNEMIKFGY
jgi:hypothetical protein